MSSHPYVTQQNTPLADDTTLMSTTDLQSYITHANDTFVQVSGFTLQELQGQPHNMVRHPDMPKAAFADISTAGTQDINQSCFVDIAMDNLGAQFYCRQQSSELTGSMRKLVLLFDNKFT